MATPPRGAFAEALRPGPAHLHQGGAFAAAFWPNTTHLHQVDDSPFLGRDLDVYTDDVVLRVPNRRSVWGTPTAAEGEWLAAAGEELRAAAIPAASPAWAPVAAADRESLLISSDESDGDTPGAEEARRAMEAEQAGDHATFEAWRTKVAAVRMAEREAAKKRMKEEAAKQKRREAAAAAEEEWVVAAAAAAAADEEVGAAPAPAAPEVDPEEAGFLERIRDLAANRHQKKLELQRLLRDYCRLAAAAAAAGMTVADYAAIPESRIITASVDYYEATQYLDEEQQEYAEWQLEKIPVDGAFNRVNRDVIRFEREREAALLVHEGNELDATNPVFIVDMARESGSTYEEARAYFEQKARESKIELDKAIARLEEALAACEAQATMLRDAMAAKRAVYDSAMEALNRALAKMKTDNTAVSAAVFGISESEYIARRSKLIRNRQSAVEKAFEELQAVALGDDATGTSALMTTTGAKWVGE